MTIDVLRMLRIAEFTQILPQSVDVRTDLQQLPLNEIWLTRRTHAEGNVGLAHCQVEFTVSQLKADINFRIQFDEFPDTRRQPSRPECGGFRHLKRSRGAFLAFSKLRFRHCQHVENFVTGAIEKLTLLSEQKTACVPVKQRRIQRRLERTDPAKRGPYALPRSRTYGRS